MRKPFKKDLFKKGIISLTYLSTVSAATTGAIIVMRDNVPHDISPEEQQAQYDAALKTLGDTLRNAPIAIDIVHGSLSAGLDSLKTKIENAISTIISKNPAMSSLLGSATVTINPGTFNDTKVSSNELSATGLSVTVVPKGNGLKTTPIIFPVKYVVINNDQDNYDQEVNTLLTTINAVDASTHTFYHNQFTTAAQVKTYIMESINSSIDDSNLYVSKFTNVSQLPDITANVTTILSDIAKGGTATPTAQTLAGVKFNSKVGGSVNTTATHNVIFDYAVVESKQDQFDAQVKELVGNFINPDSGSFNHVVLSMINDESVATATAKIQTLINGLVLAAPVRYTAINTKSPTIKGLTATSFHKNPGDYSTQEAISGVTISFTSTFASGVNPTPDLAFNFYYTVQPTTPETTIYSNALKAIVNHFKETTTPGSGTPTPTNILAFDYDGTTDATAWKKAVQSKIQTAIFNYVSTSAFTTNYPGVFDLGSSPSSANIKVTVTSSNFVNQVSKMPSIVSSGISFSIPSGWTGTLGITNASSDLTIYKTVGPTQALVTSAANKIKDYFANSKNQITMKRLGIETESTTPTNKTVEEYIADAINTYISGTHTGKPGDVGLTENEKAALGPVTSKTVTGIDSISLATNQQNQSKNAIGLNFVGNVTSQTTKLSDFTLYYNVVANPNDTGAQQKLQDIITAVVTNSNTTKIALLTQDSSATITTAIKTAILKEAQKSTYDTYFKGVDINDITVSAITTGTGDNKIDVSTENKTGRSITGTGITANIAVKTASTTFAANTSAVALTGLKYTVANDKQFKYEAQVTDILKGWVTYTGTNAIALNTSMTDTEIKLAVRLSLITYVTGATGLATDLVKAITADAAGLAAITMVASTETNKSFDISTATATTGTTGTTRTSQGITVTYQPSVGHTVDVTPKALGANIIYTVVNGATSENYTAALDAIGDHFKVTPLFTVVQGSTLDYATAKPLVQKAIADYVALKTGGLSPIQKASIADLGTNGANIVVNSFTSGNPSTLVGGNVKTSKFIVTIPTYTGATAIEYNMRDALYNVSESVAQALYESQVNNVVASITSATKRLKLSDTDGIPEVKTKLATLINAYIADPTHAADTTATGTSTLTNIPEANITTTIDPTPGTSVDGATNVTFKIPPKVSTGLYEYSKVQSIFWSAKTAKQAAYDNEVEQVWNNIGTAANPITIFKGDNEAKIKQHIMDAANAYIWNVANNLSQLGRITEQGIATTGISTAVATDAATHDISVTIEKSATSTAVQHAFTTTLNYSVVDVAKEQQAHTDLTNQIASGTAVIPNASWRTSAQIGSINILDHGWNTTQMNNSTYTTDTFLPYVNNLFAIYYSSLSPAVKAQMDKIFGQGANVISSFEVTADLNSGATSFTVKLKFKTPFTWITPVMSTAIITFKQGA